jgi:hypothetical protein
VSPKVGTTDFMARQSNGPGNFERKKSAKEAKEAHFEQEATLTT